MNRRIVFRTVGLIVLLESALFLISAFVALTNRAPSLSSFLFSAALSAGFGLVLFFCSKPRSRVIYAKEGFAITSLAWVLLSAFGALPFYCSGQIPDYIDAFFETVSGFTTTGASILPRVEDLDPALLFWRSFTNWIGGMGVLVFLMIFLPNMTDRPIHIMRAEMPGPTVGKLLPKARDTAKILYIMYLLMTLVLFLLLSFGGMNPFDSLLHSFSAAGTGGFGLYSDSLASFTPYQIWVISIFLFLFGINFNLYYLILIRRFRSAFRSTELRVYCAIVLISIAILCVDLYGRYESFSELLMHSSLQVLSIFTTAGFSTTNFDLWPTLSKSVLLILMFIGGCAGSTAGGIKVSRVIMLFKNCFSELRQMLHPRSVNVLQLDGKKVEKETQTGVSIYFTLYCLCFFGIFFLLSLNGLDFETTFTAVASTFNNVGPGFAGVGPMENFSVFSDFSKLLLSFSMLLGRLEIWPILLSFQFSLLKKRKK